jgi:AraC family transcriptional regulator of adaptative response/methylated-DNA-[protein]-cysteine methyltransferase
MEPSQYTLFEDQRADGATAVPPPGFETTADFRDALAQSLGHQPAEASDSTSLIASWIESPVGPLLAISDQNHLRLLEFFDRKILSRQLVKLQKSAGSGVCIGRTAPIEQIQRELDVYFEGQSPVFKTPLAPVGTEFEDRAWTALLAVPPGQTRSYGQQAIALDQPTATRAVARANGANPISIVIPCHRIIGSDGSLTGYGGGLWRKEWLLDHERRAFR